MVCWVSCLVPASMKHSEDRKKPEEGESEVVPEVSRRLMYNVLMALEVADCCVIDVLSAKCGCKSGKLCVHISAVCKGVLNNGFSLQQQWNGQIAYIYSNNGQHVGQLTLIISNGKQIWSIVVHRHPILLQYYWIQWANNGPTVAQLFPIVSHCLSNCFQYYWKPLETVGRTRNRL